MSRFEENRSKTDEEKSLDEGRRVANSGAKTNERPLQDASVAPRPIGQFRGDLPQLRARLEVSSAGRGPPEQQADIQARKIFRDRPFEMILTLDSACLRAFGLCPGDVVNACIAAKCVNSSTGEEVVSCKVCAPSRGIVAIDSDDGFFPEVSPEGVVRFAFDSCRVRCSSSRMHVGSPLALVVRLAGVAIVSNQFVIMARGRSKRLVRRDSDSQALAACSPEGTAATTATAENGETRVENGKRESNGIAMLPNGGRDKAAPNTKAAAFVYILTDWLQPNFVLSLATCHIWLRLVENPKFGGMRALAAGGMYMMFFYYANAEAGEEGMRFVRNFFDNTGGVANPFGRPLSDMALSILHCIKSW